MQGSDQRKHGYSLIELVVVLTIVGVVLAIAVPRTQLALDRISVRSAAGDVAATVSWARSFALAGRAAVAVEIDTAAGVVRVRQGADTLLARGIGQAHGVRMDATRDSLTYDPRGLGRGAANLSIVLRRRSAVETVFVSRLGRLRWTS